MGKSFAVVAALALGALACGGGTKKRAEQPAESARGPRPAPLIAPIVTEAPPELFGVLVVPNPTEALRSLNAMYAAVAPDTAPLDGAVVDLVVGAMVGGSPIVGIDHGAPVRMLFLDPAAADRWIVAVVGVSDEKALRAWAESDEITIDVRGELAIVGSPAAVPVVADYAASNLATKPLPKHITATAFVERMRVKYAQELVRVFDDFEGALAANPDPKVSGAAKAYTEAFYSFVEQTGTVSLSYEMAADELTLVFEIAGVAGSTMAKVAATQQPSDYSMLDRFEIDGAAIAFAGEIDWTPMQDSMIALMDVVFPELAGDAEARGAWAELMKQYKGQTVLRMDLAPFRVTTAYQVADPKEALRLNRFWATTNVGATNGMSLEPVGTPELEHAGVPIDVYKMKFDKSKMSAQQLSNSLVAEWLSGGLTANATVDDYLISVMSVGAVGDMKRLIDRLAGGRTGTASRGPVPTASRQRHESAVMWVDIGAFVAAFAPTAPPMDARLDIGLGFTETSWLVRFSIGADDIAAIAAAASAAQQPPADPTLVTDIEALTDEACECKDTACAERVQEKLMSRIENAAEPSKPDQERILKSLERMGGCLSQIAPPPE